MGTIDCGHCGRPTPKTRANKKWCGRCRVLKTIIALGKYPADCRICGTPFFKHDRRAVECQDCEELYIDREPSRDPCAICHGHRPSPSPDVKLCYRCICSNSEETHRLVQGGARRRLRELID